MAQLRRLINLPLTELMGSQSPLPCFPGPALPKGVGTSHVRPRILVSLSGHSSWPPPLKSSGLFLPSAIHLPHGAAAPLPAQPGDSHFLGYWGCEPTASSPPSHILILAKEYHRLTVSCVTGSSQCRRPSNAPALGAPFSPRAPVKLVSKLRLALGRGWVKSQVWAPKGIWR